MPRARPAAQKFLDRGVVEPPKRGQQAKYRKDWHDQLAFELALLQHTDPEIAKVFGVSVTTISDWQKAHKSFGRAIESGRVEADAKVAAGWYKRAAGHTITTEHLHINQKTGQAEVIKLTKEIPPDPKASGQWLSVRQRKRWGQTQQVEHTFSQKNTELLQRMTPDEREQMRTILLAASSREPVAGADADDY